MQNKISHPTNFTTRFFGIVLTFATIGAVELMHNSWIKINNVENPSSILLLPIVFTSFVGGIKQGMVATVITFIYSLHLFPALDSRQSSDVAMQNITLLGVASLIMTLMVGAMAAEQKRLARTDTLTDLSNRRSFFELANNELNRARRYGDPISIAYVDIDNFKAINDSIGHSAGDALLRLVAQTIGANIRKVDVAARLGGDEFALLLPEASAASAYSALQRLELELMKLMNKNEWLVTFSIGVATFESPPASVDDMINTADSLMYDAKHGGKNQIKQAIYSARKVVAK